MGSPTTTLWVRALVDELARCGVRDVVVAPGSRSTPLVFAFDRDERFRVRVHLDERSAGFFALGVGKGTGLPAVVVTTSGTATANLLPAVVEAAQSESPLLVLTADRPHRLRDADANQAIDQVGLYGSYTREAFELSLPRATPESLRHLRTVACRAVAAASGPSAGPVHINLPFEKPLEPAEGLDSFVGEHPIEASGRPGGRPFVAVEATPGAAPSVVLSDLVGRLDLSRALLVAGPAPNPEAVGPAAQALSSAWGLPLLADALSGARFGPDAGAPIAAYDAFLRDPGVRAALRPSAILRVGRSPTSTAVQEWMADHDGVPHIVIDSGTRWKDFAGVATEVVRADAAATLWALAGHPGRVDAEWTERWLASGRAAGEALAPVSEGDLHEGHLLATVADAVPAGSDLFVSSSMPVRDMDRYAPPKEAPMTVFGNRGASGIDGIVSTAFGLSAGRGRPVVCALGDIAFFHDQNGLLFARESDATVVFVLIDNDGGGIFHMLPVAEHGSTFTRYFATPHGLDFTHTAELFGLPFEDAAPDEVGAALDRLLESGNSAILRVKTSREANHAGHDIDRAAAVRAVRELLDLS